MVPARCGRRYVMEILLALSIGLAAGLIMSRVVKPLGLPAVTGYLVAGILVGPYCLGLLGQKLGIAGLGFTSAAAVEQMTIISDVALGFIAFSIGNEFRFSQLKKTGKQTTVIGILQAVVTTLIVDAVLVAVSFIPGSPLSLPAALTLGAVAAATAPAATLMVVHQYKAHGPLTDVLLPVVALDDAVGLVLFAVSFGVARAISDGGVSILSIVLNPLIEIVASLLLGLVTGLLFTFAEKHFNSGSKRLSLAVTFVIFTVALSQLEFSFGEVKIGFSSLLVCMMLGSVFCNTCDFSEDMMEKTDKWTAPLYVIFFVLSGAALKLDVFLNIAVVGIGLLYVVFRAGGKYLGAWISAKIVRSDRNIRRYLGVTLFPQAGVALGMSLMAMALPGGAGETVRNITLFAVLVYELVGPVLTKIALTKAGEITPKATRVVSGDDDE